jgi:hypothetical protein
VSISVGAALQDAFDYACLNGDSVVAVKLFRLMEESPERNLWAQLAVALKGKPPH